MQSTDAERLMFAAHGAYVSGDHDGALRLLDQLGQTLSQSADAVHLRALVLKAQGQFELASQTFSVANRALPNDAQLLTNWGNLFAQFGQLDAALVRYDSALEANADFEEARFNRALALRQQGRLSEALQELDTILAREPALAKAHSERGALLKDLGKPGDAICAFDRALTLEPQRPIALAGRARLALETGAEDAVDRHILALQQSPGNRALVLGVVQAMLAQGDQSGLDILQEVLRQDPTWIEGHHELALLQAETGAGDAFVAHIQEALAQLPNNPALRQLLGAVLSSATLYDRALDALREGEIACGAQPDWEFEIARLEGECGDREAAWSSLAAMADSDLSRQVRGRLALRTGRIEEAAHILEGLVQRSPEDVIGWAYLAMAWRLLDDDRYNWLAGQAGLWCTAELELDDQELLRLTQVLRNIHRAHAHPIGQSLRGGTQTRGRLFWRREPELSALEGLLEQAVAGYVAGLPAYDAGHPLLRHRNDRLRLAGSWSVRLVDKGFHVSHIHPEGTVSSACYIAVPPATNGDDRAGWLEIGGAPAELNLGLEPLAQVEPIPGRLALFPSYLFHGTRAFPRGERLTVAFDAIADV